MNGKQRKHVWQREQGIKGGALKDKCKICDHVVGFSIEATKLFSSGALIHFVK